MLWLAVDVWLAKTSQKTGMIKKAWQGMLETNLNLESGVVATPQGIRLA